MLGELGHAGKVLAGGQSLLPMLSMRIVAAEHLVDINRLSELAYVRADSTGVRVGALARHTAVFGHDAAAGVQPLLRQALKHVAHPTIRNRGTTVGSLAHADPSAELTAVLALTEGFVTVAHADGRREVAAADFFLGTLESTIEPGELAVEAFFPDFATGTGTAFLEIARRNGDYALCGVAAAVTKAPDGTVTQARTAYISMSPVPVVLSIGDCHGDPAEVMSWQAAAEQAAAQLEPESDLHASADYRRQLARVLTARALAAAATPTLNSS